MEYLCDPIVIYASWEGQTDKEILDQLLLLYTVGDHYLASATGYFVQELYDSPNLTAKIPAKVLERRLPRTLELLRESTRALHSESDTDEIVNRVAPSFIKFAELCKQKEEEIGEPVTIIAD